MMRRLAVLMGMLMVFGCGGPAAPTGASADIVGEWNKEDKSMPPINLLITRDADVIRVRLRFSGVESNGTVTVDGGHIRLHLPGRSTLIVGEFISNTELTLQLDLNPSTHRLRKRTP